MVAQLVEPPNEPSQQEIALLLSARSCRRVVVALACVLAGCSDAEVLAPTANPTVKASFAEYGGEGDTVKVAVGESVQLESSLYTNVYHPILWTSSNPDVAAVSYWHGTLTAKADGDVVVTATNGGEQQAFRVRVGEQVASTGDQPEEPPPHPEDPPAHTEDPPATGGDTVTTIDARPPMTGDLATRLLGQTTTADQVRSLGSVYSQYEDNFTRYDDVQWAAYGTRWDLFNYYDRAMIYYAWNRHTGDPKYLARANAVALDYRRNYIEAARYLISPHWAMLDGVAMHYLTTGDEASRTAVGRVGDLFTGLSFRESIGSRTGTDNRIQSRYIETLLLAQQIQAPSTGVPAGGISGGHDWAAELRRALPLILSTQDADGAFRLSDCGDGGPRAVHPFTTGLLMDALTRYYELFEADARILPAVKRAADYLWANDWIPSAAAFRYIERQCPSEGGPGAAPDLNNLIVNGYAWVYKQTGDITYKQRADAIFAGAVNGAWLSPTKQFNQVYSSSLRYMAYRR